MDSLSTPTLATPTLQPHTTAREHEMSSSPGQPAIVASSPPSQPVPLHLRRRSVVSSLALDNCLATRQPDLLSQHSVTSDPITANDMAKLTSEIGQYNYPTLPLTIPSTSLTPTPSSSSTPHTTTGNFLVGSSKIRPPFFSPVPLTPPSAAMQGAMSCSTPLSSSVGSPRFHSKIGATFTSTTATVATSPKFPQTLSHSYQPLDQVMSGGVGPVPSHFTPLPTPNTVPTMARATSNTSTWNSFVPIPQVSPDPWTPVTTAPMTYASAVAASPLSVLHPFVPNQLQSHHPPLGISSIPLASQASVFQNFDAFAPAQEFTPSFPMQLTTTTTNNAPPHPSPKAAATALMALSGASPVFSELATMPPATVGSTMTFQRLPDTPMMPRAASSPVIAMPPTLMSGTESDAGAMGKLAPTINLVASPSPVPSGSLIGTDTVQDLHSHLPAASIQTVIQNTKRSRRFSQPLPRATPYPAAIGESRSHAAAKKNRRSSALAVTASSVSAPVSRAHSPVLSNKDGVPLYSSAALSDVRTAPGSPSASSLTATPAFTATSPAPTAVSVSPGFSTLKVPPPSSAVTGTFVPHDPASSATSGDGPAASAGSKNAFRVLLPKSNPADAKTTTTDGPGVAKGSKKGGEEGVPRKRRKRRRLELPCPFEGCGRVFPRKYNLRSHMACHSDERPNVCEICRAAFARKHDLSRHMRTLHNKKRPFACATCDQRFSRADQLIRHMLAEHGASCGVGDLMKVGSGGAKKQAVCFAEDEQMQHPVIMDDGLDLKENVQSYSENGPPGGEVDASENFSDGEEGEEGDEAEEGEEEEGQEGDTEQK
ncbi:Metallothionein expression activator [Phlyctochytrium bullatum]|nr:Metallothionein expression activator [Phlyctochytrium bullatum]